tara:strand:+ start:359 stop:718 length:360 start_codon:yes stop_codon:yes gene_type:complete
MLNKKGDIMKHHYYLYYAISLHDGEGMVFTVGITRDLKRRSYEKHMHVVWYLYLGEMTKKEAMVPETKAKNAVKDDYPLAFVKFGAWDMKGYKQDRGWDWYYIGHNQEGPLDIIKGVVQ